MTRQAAEDVTSVARDQPLQTSRNILAEVAKHLTVTSSDAAKSDAAPPAVVLTIPALKLENLNLDAQDLSARIAALGIHLQVDGLQLEGRGLEVQAMLTLHAGAIADIVDRVLTTFDDDPNMLRHVLESLTRATEAAGSGVRGSDLESDTETD